MNKKINSKLAIVIILVLSAALLTCTLYLERYPVSIFFPSVLNIFRSPEPSVPSTPEVSGFEKFSSVQDFKIYLSKAQADSGTFPAIGIGGRMEVDVALPFLGMDEAAKSTIAQPGEAVDRVSGTNVQVLGIDEPDIVKTDGEEIYFSSESYYYGGWDVGWGMEIMPRKEMGQTKAIKAFPPADLKIDGEIDKIGNLLLYEDILMIFSGDTIYGYDVSDPKNPKEEWIVELEDRNIVAGARLYEGKIYLITRTEINTYRPCPITPLTFGGSSLEIRCADIYHPVDIVPIDATYTVVSINPKDGEIKDTISFVGASNSSIIYVSENAIYVTYSYYDDIAGFYVDFLTKECSDIIPSSVIEKLEKLAGYDISDSSKEIELQVILNNYYASLSEDEELKIRNEVEDRKGEYFAENKRLLEKTGIAKIEIDNLKVVATGIVPGKPLNQFSLDEYEGHLRIATTIGERWWRFGFGGTEDTANDIYILDKDLNEVGSVKDLGEERERIYSVRFIQDKGYLVTFFQKDPFYVLDLSDPTNPEVRGELKIPGYSAYLHPITKDKILGVGKEGSKVKISLFDVEDPKNPKEIDKYTLDEYWSDVLNNHHAFLLDDKHEIFFLPGSRGGYIFSYENNDLKMVKAVSGIQAKRALYINDYLYIIGDNEIVVLNEKDWERVNELKL